MDTGWYCSQCGRRDGSEIALYQNGGMFNAHSKRLDPRCRVCGTLVVFHKNGHSAEATHLSSKVLIVNGTCASGKTTISYLMSEHYDFVQVDGDWVLEREKLRRKQPVNGDDIHHDLIDFYDNSHETPEETTENIFKSL